MLGIMGLCEVLWLLHFMLMSQLIFLFRFKMLLTSVVEFLHTEDLTCWAANWRNFDVITDKARRNDIKAA